MVEPGTLIISVIGLVTQLIGLVRAIKGDNGGKRSKRCQEELHRFADEFEKTLQFAHDVANNARAVGFASKSLDILHNELGRCVPSVKAVFSRSNSQKEDIQQLREHATVIEKLIGRITFEMCIKSNEEIQIVKEMLSKNSEEIKSLQEMLSKNSGVQINIFQGQAQLHETMLTWLFSYMEKPTVWELLRRVMNASAHLNLVMPTEETGPFVHLLRVADAGIVKGVAELGKIKKDTTKYVLKEKQGKEKDMVNFRNQAQLEKDNKKGALVVEEAMERPKVEKGTNSQNRNIQQHVLTKEGAGVDVLKEEAEKMKETPSSIMGRAPDQWTTQRQDNPNRKMELVQKEDQGKVLISRNKEGCIEITQSEKSIAMVTGNSPIEVSKKLGYCYFEVKLRKVEGSADVGVGLARWDKLENKIREGKMAGKYSKSCGYDGRVGNVYCERNFLEGPSRIGRLEMGDTLGVGLLRKHRVYDHIFFAKNGELKVCFPIRFNWEPSSDRGLCPVISLASTHVHLCVDFQVPSDLSKLLKVVKTHIQLDKR